MHYTEISVSRPETVCDLDTEQEATDGYRQAGYKAKYRDYDVPKKPQKSLNFFPEYFSYSSADHVTITYESL